MKEFNSLAKKVIDGYSPDREERLVLLKTPSDRIFDLLGAANNIRQHFFADRIHLCTICNGKSGKCGEDCGFCSQSVFAEVQSPIYPLLSKNELMAGGIHASETPINRYSVVTSGGRLPKKEIIKVADAQAELKQHNIQCCASLGILDEKDLLILKKAGVNRYHHNLETCKSFFPKICSSHLHEERVNTIKLAKKSGLSVCSGGIFGMGETDYHLLELADELAALEIDAMPINFLVPIAGTLLQSASFLSPLRCLQIIAFFRFVLPEKELIVCGGREYNLKQLHPLVFFAGASGIMTGNYLTTEGRTLEKDLELIESLGLRIRE